ncbi:MULTISPECIES: hypothetical protein [Vagococcus]|uniref:hypothetical protein n=1 Tax=Vagococcus TaxID=2737 RepID=UPI0013147D90|nr:MULTISPECIES: hypothetical protein [Vagococcus]
MSYDCNEVIIMVTNTSKWQNKMNHMLKESENEALESYKDQLKVYNMIKIKQELVDIKRSVHEIERFLSDKIKN